MLEAEEGTADGDEEVLGIGQAGGREEAATEIAPGAAEGRRELKLIIVIRSEANHVPSSGRSQARLLPAPMTPAYSFPGKYSGKQAAYGGLSLGTLRKSVDLRTPPARSGQVLAPAPSRIPLTQRNPMLLLSLSGLLLLRLAHRVLLALLFQSPPRNTRLLAFRSHLKWPSIPVLFFLSMVRSRPASHDPANCSSGTAKRLC